MTASQGPLPKVLAIDDSELIHRLLRVRLQHEPLEIHGSMDAREGLELARRMVPDVILLDIEMRGMDGFQVLKALKDDVNLQDIPVIFISATASMEDRVRAIDHGAIDFVAKPFEVVELKARVRSAIRIHQMVKMLAQKAQVDGLTGLWNRTYFDRRLLQEVAEAVRHGRSVSLVMCDVDGFKKLNDECGHPYGDAVLERVARILQGGRSSDIACRYGGEEFGIILPNTLGAEAVEVAERYREAIASESWPGTPARMITASFGVSDLTLLSGTQGSDDLVASADAALFRAKANGRNRIEVAPVARPAG
jgi:diguanylate cyclase (GGDEF)-like protein